MLGVFLCVVFFCGQHRQSLGNGLVPEQREGCQDGPGGQVGKPKPFKAIKSASDNAWHFAMHALAKGCQDRPGDQVGKPKPFKAIKSASDNAWHFAMHALATCYSSNELIIAHLMIQDHFH
jgi:hypothetical protein